MGVVDGWIFFCDVFFRMCVRYGGLCGWVFDDLMNMKVVLKISFFLCCFVMRYGGWLGI